MKCYIAPIQTNERAAGQHIKSLQYVLEAEETTGKYYSGILIAQLYSNLLACLEKVNYYMTGHCWTHSGCIHGACARPIFCMEMFPNILLSDANTHPGRRVSSGKKFSRCVCVKPKQLHISSSERAKHHKLTDEHTHWLNRVPQVI